MPDSGLVPPGIAYLADNIVARGNIMGTSKARRAEWARGLRFAADNATIFFAGCGYQYAGELDYLMSINRKVEGSPGESILKLPDFQKRLGVGAALFLHKVTGGGDDTGSQPLRDAVWVLERLGIKPGYLGEEEPCCGGLLYYAGLHQEFAQNTQKAFDRLKAKGVKRVISIVPSCTYTLRDLATRFVLGYDLEVQHFVEVVAKKIDTLELSVPNKIKVTYHDPCQLVRYLGIVEQPRLVLQAIKGVELVEPAYAKKEWATCCGGGGGFEAVFPGLSEILAKNRVRELMETGAEVIVTHCPGCIMQLKHGLKELGHTGIKVLDLAELVAMAMGKS